MPEPIAEPIAMPMAEPVAEVEARRDRAGAGAWLEELEEGAPDVVAAYRGIDERQFLSVRREVRRRARPGSVDGLVVQLAATANALAAAVERLPARAHRMPGGEEDWNVAQTVGHVAHARAGLVLAASLAAAGRFPDGAGPVVPGVAGPADADRNGLLEQLARSQRLIDRAARRIAGHESDACALDHPLVGRLRCGEWLLFAGVHDCMHLQQLAELAARVGATTVAAQR
jgi:hypothetical protein